MHNLERNFRKIYQITKSAFSDLSIKDGNFYSYSNKPKCSDLEIIALAISAEAIGIDSENYLYGKLKSDQPKFFSTFPDRTNYNRRKRKLRPFIDQLSTNLISKINPTITTCLIDSMPLPVCRKARAKRLKILKDEKDLEPQFGYSAIDRNYFFGYKLHCLSHENGTIQNFSITQANVSDAKMLNEMAIGYISDCTLLGDKGYVNRENQLKLFVNENITLVTPFRKNQVFESDWSPIHRKKRKRIETIFSQFCDQFVIKRNYAKTFSGYYARITTKICAFTCLQFINFNSNRPLNQIKHALAF